MADETTGIGYFPSEILTEVLKRLPSKSLCRFRCVSQAWRSLIFDPTFVQLHRNFSESRPMLLFTNIHCDSFSDHNPLLQVSLHGDGAAESSSPFLLPFYFSWQPHYVARPVAGLMCLNLRDRILICNPGTREQVTIPYPVASELITLTNFWASLCFDPVDNIHKIFCLFKNSNYVFSWGSDRWRRIQDMPTTHYQEFSCRAEICIDGILYYTVRR